MAHPIVAGYVDCAIFVREETVLAMNEKARTMFPGLCPGNPAPQWMELPGEEDCEGCVSLEGRTYRLVRTGEEGGWVYTLSSREQQTLTQEQLDGVLYRMRTLLEEFRYRLAPTLGDERGLTGEEKDGLAGSHDQMRRLVDHLDLLRDGPRAVDRGVIELGELCRAVALECGGLLREVGLRVEFIPLPVPLYVRGDRERLENALVELISNCAKRLKEEGVITLRLTRRGGKGIICVTDSGPDADGWERLRLTTRGAAPRIPRPGDGAGLGLSVAEGVALSHRGSIFFVPQGRPKVYLVLPETRDLGGVTFQTPKMERNAGRNPYIIALSDVLPGRIIREDWKE